MRRDANFHVKRSNVKKLWSSKALINMFYVYNTNLYSIAGSAHNVAVLSALVDKKQSWDGCQRHCITLSLCSPTTTLGSGRVRSAEKKISF